ncbi:hypothetical protein A3K73_05345 [Candidatus Pacearchaeota archaeon RBG_13_36_9]|nr:MAG: hypothetical protein A3K73_05345 [Candidatus Pacearchaeota archaeon RBG_13_36_9]
MPKEKIKKSVKKKEKKEVGNGFGIVGFVLGMIALAVWCMFFIGFSMGIVFGLSILILPTTGFIFCIIQMRMRVTKLSIIGYILNLLFLLLLFFMIISQFAK